MTFDTPPIDQTEIPMAPSARPRFRQKEIVGYPQLRDLFAIPSVAISVVVLAFSGLMGTLPILLFYALWLPRTIYKGQFILRPSRDIIPLILFGFYALVSVLWSDYPASTLRPALELISMIACMIIMVRVSSMEAFVKGIILGTVIVLIVTLASGHYGKDAFSDNFGLIGLFGSKNQVGLYAEVGFLVSIVFFVAGKGRLQKFFYFVCPLGLYGVCLYFSRSGTSISTFAVLLLVLYGVHCIIKFSPRNRKIALIASIILAVLAAAIGIALGGETLFLHVMGKDATLTGRTYLWAEGIKNGLKAPVFGHGYGAFWVIGRPEAEKYWFKFGIFNRSGFHFHNLYIETFVELGAIGLLIMLYMIIANCVRSLRYAIRHGSSLKTYFCTGVAFMLLIRAFVEVDFLGPFSIGSLLFLSLGPLLAEEPKPRTEPAITAGKQPFSLPSRRSRQCF